MRRRIVAGTVTVLITAAMFVMPGVSPVAPAGAQAAGGTRSIPASGTTVIGALPNGPEGLQAPEVRGRSRRHPSPMIAAAGEPQGQASVFGGRHPRGDDPFPEAPLPPPRVRSSAVAGTDAELSVDGLNHRDQRLANNGNQFSVEPPDQALCVGNGFVVEAVNEALRVRDTNGAPVTGVRDLNTFFGYPAAIDRTVTPPVFGPSVFDVVCLYDPDFRRFVVVVDVLQTDPATGDLTGKHSLDVAVTNTSDPSGAWTLYRIPAHNDGTDGTPNHGCTIDGTTPGPCFNDYPHIGADRNGIYISANEYDLFGPGYNTANIYALSKRELAAHGTVRVTLLDNLTVGGTPGFTVWPAISPPREYSNERGGTEYFLSTIAGDGSETGNPTRTARKIGVWAVSNTRSLNSPTVDLRITSRLIDSQTYVFPPTSTQPTGPFPLGECVNDTTIPTPLGNGCWRLLLAEEPAHDEVISRPDSLDSRMQQTWFVNGQLWGASGTEVIVGGESRAGIAWFRVDPQLDLRGRIRAEVERQGYIALTDNNLTMPAIAMTREGDGAIAFSVMGETFFPSAAYVRISDHGRVGPIRIAAQGAGVDDGFTSYKAFVGDPPRTRWGDYGAAVTDGDDIWIASEYIAQSCTLEEWLAGAIGSCGGTRTALANWATRLSRLDT
jgi:hypothetical protein